MDKIRLSDVESIRVMRVGGNLRVRGVSSGETIVACDGDPQIRKVENRAEMLISSNADFEVAAGVALEVFECAGNLEVEDYSAPLSLGRVRGNLRARRMGSLAIRGEIGGNLTIEEARSIEGEQVNGNLRIETARSVKFRRVSGNTDCRSIEGEVSFDDVAGRLRVSEAGPVIANRVGGKLEVETVASLAAPMVGNKVKAVGVVGDVILGKVGGRLSCDDIGGSVTAELVGGHVGIRGVRGGVTLPEVGGAVDLLGPLPDSGTWNLTSRGRISVEVSAETSAKISATARYGRVRFYGVPETGFTRTGRDHVEGTIGEGTLELNLEATDADIILFGESPESRDYDGRRRSRDFRFGRRFSAPFENFAEDLREDIPEFVSGIVGAAGRIVAESGKFSGTIAHDVTRTVAEAIHEVERAVADLDAKVPHEVSDKLSRLGRKITEVVERAMDEARERRREKRGREESGSEHREASASEGSPQGAEGTQDETLLKILNAVREGSLKPEEADRLISAWLELRRGSGAKHPE